jgi:threonine/homoserine/homoserine lactone efflux protein
MSSALIVGFFVFAFVASVTPGPNNLMLMASGATFGIRRSTAHIAGVCIGFSAMTIAVGLGLAGLFRILPWLYVVLRWGAAAYILYLALRMALAKGVGQGFTGAKPMSFWGAAAFQWINPKAWVMALGAVTTYALPGHMLQGVGFIALVFLLFSMISCLSWAAFGVGIKRFLREGWHLRAFNAFMAALLMASLYPLVTEPVPLPAKPAAPAARP